MMSDGRGVVITGLGLVLPHGTGLRAADAVFDGRSAVRRLPLMEGIPDATGAPVLEFTPLPGTEQADRAVQFAVAATREALARANLVGEVDPYRVATVISLSKGGILTMAEARRSGDADDLWRQAGPQAAAASVAAHFHFAGPVVSPVTACASGGHALAWGAAMIERGAADAAVVGAVEASLHPLVLGSYRRMGVLAPGGDDPAASVRPFSATRRGFAIGEGAGILVLESQAGADRRGVRVLARLAGWACGSQASGLTEMEEDGGTLAHLLSTALGRARVTPEQVDYVNAHGTATLLNDRAEARAIRTALGDAADRINVSSTKGSHGHLLGAAAAVELVLTVLAIERGLVPPTANLTDPDPEIRLDCTPLEARRRTIRCAVKTTSGFGGQAAAVVLVRP